MKKLLILNASMSLSRVTIFAKSLEKFYDVFVTGSKDEHSYKYKTVGKYAKEKFLTLSSTVPISLKQFDVVMSLDQAGIPFLCEVKEHFPNIKVGVQFLDYPLHVFKKNKNYIHGISCIFAEYVEIINKLDFIIHNQKIALDLLEEYQKDVAVDFILYPVLPFKPKQYERKNTIVFSGRIDSDKGVGYIIEALSLLEVEERPKLITIGNGFNLKPYADFLLVEYENIRDCSEKDKWKHYYESRFLISASDNEYVPSLCPLEGISIGRSSVVFDFPESYRHYGDYVYYCPPINIQVLASTIKFLYKQSEFCDDRAKNGPAYYKKEASYESWGKKVNKLIEKTL